MIKNIALKLFGNSMTLFWLLSDVVEIKTPVSQMASDAHDISDEDMFTHTSFANMGKRLKAYNDTLALLHELGIQHELELPELVLVGDQSTGKSSLMSGLAGMNLPRSGGVCTRCVIHIHSSRSANVSCRVSLRLKYRYQPPNGRIEPHHVSKENPFPPWVPQHEISKEFKTIDKLEEVEEVLRWAQIAILNPDKNHEQYIPGLGHTAMNMSLNQAAECTTAKFSPNVVALELKGTEYANLSYYDLPGVFVTSTDENDMHLVKVVENLTAEYITHPGAIILWACPMNQDPVNSTTFKLIRRNNAQSRTLGVMTKADLISEDDPTSHQQWLSMLNGENNMRTGHGYFVTSRQSNKSLEEQNRWENRFFEGSSMRWPVIFTPFVERTGVGRLRKHLSEMLFKALTDSMPAIKNQVMSRYDSACREFQALPEAPRNIEMEINRSLFAFVANVKAGMNHPDFSSALQKLCEQFRGYLLAMKPRVILSDASDYPDVIDLGSEDESQSDRSPPQPPSRNLSGGKKRPQEPPFNTPSKKPRKDTGGITNFSNGSASRYQAPAINRGDDYRILRQQATNDNQTPLGPFSNVDPQMKQSIGQVRDIIKSFSRAGLPDVVSAEVYVFLFQQAVIPWERPMNTMLRQCAKLVSDIITKAAEDALSGLRKRVIFDRVSEIMSRFIQERTDQTQEWLRKTHKMHTLKPFTLETSDFQQLRSKETERLVHNRHFHRWKAFRSEPDLVYRPWGNMSAEERNRDLSMRQIQASKMGPDPFHKEIKVYAYIGAYYRLAASRFTDAICLAISSDLFPTITETLDTAYLEQELGLLTENGTRSQSPEVYERLMMEDMTTSVKREKLRQEVKKFEKALESIRQLRRDEADPRSPKADGEAGDKARI
ncbi:Interferon-induced GTP-binding protein Mx [Ceratocystis fimbriata CBS 114723]|uniref:Interferon-induced GTP-binding protein Mx n=1 Tax=Ceratocystis fimbriata CBS 114723 TaxID=1035309 RepID=A0A2C5X546_9PEZI|nr:Interferon-induced GTP-binding protein Mx [Ceratocystis fimbriata CBS 114723]